MFSCLIFKQELQKKLSTAESTSGKQILSLTLALQEKATKLETYEKIHQKMERYLFPGQKPMDNKMTFIIAFTNLLLIPAKRN